MRIINKKNNSQECGSETRESVRVGPLDSYLESLIKSYFPVLHKEIMFLTILLEKCLECNDIRHGSANIHDVFPIR